MAAPASDHRLSRSTGLAADGARSGQLPKYLLAPEVSALLHYVPDLHRKMLLATLWNTGARINEALALTLEGIFAGTAISVRTAGHAEATCREGCQNSRTSAHAAVRPIVWFRYQTAST